MVIHPRLGAAVFVLGVFLLSGQGCSGTPVASPDGGADAGPDGKDVDPPAIAFTAPSDGALAHGTVAVSVVATDASKVRSLAFLAPTALVSTQALLSPDQHTAALSTTFDVSALPDGDVTLRVGATDEWGSTATKSVTIHVSNHGPIVTITAPSPGAAVAGVVTITATARAQAQGATVTALDVIQGPPGLGSDTAPSADAYSASWDTTKALEGPLTVRLRATDSAGGIGEATAAVVVDNVPFGVVHAAVWAGVPVQGATVRLVAVDPSTGQPLAGRDGGPVLGTSSSVTDADGGITFVLAQENYSGPVQLQATGSSLFVVDPSDGVTSVAVPATLTLTSYIGSYGTGAELTAHATLWTTLADSAARAVALWKNPDAGTPADLPAALAITDPLMALHVSRPSPWNVRTVRPVSLTGAPQALRSEVYAAIPDVALHQLARDLSAAGGLTPGTSITAFSLAQQLAGDVDDGLFDGLAGIAQLAVPGTPPYALDANTTRFRLASSLDAFIRGPRNATGLTRADLQTAGVFGALAGDTSPLYPSSSAPIRFDSTPPTTTITATFSNGSSSSLSPVGSSSLVSGVVAFAVSSTDLSGLRSLTASVSSGSLVPAQGNSPTTYGASLDTTGMADGSYTFTAHACDKAGSCGDATFTFVVDNTPPTATFAAPDAGYYATAVLVDATAADAHGVASLMVTNLPGFADTNPAAECAQGRWTFPPSLAEGPLAVTVKACDVVANCATSTSTAAIVDKTPPTTSIVVTYIVDPTAIAGAPPVGTSHLVGGAVLGTANASDQAGVASVVLSTPGATLVPRSSGNTPAHFAATLDSSTLPDGPSSFVAHACDGAGNCGDTTYALTIDNTPPSITVGTPVSGYYSTSLSVSASAMDTSGVATLLVPTLSGFTDTSPAAGVIAGTWVFPSLSLLPDGPVPVVFASNDVVGNVATASVANVNADRAPPSVAWVNAPPAWSNSATLTASATATDTGAGVSTVMFNLVGSSGPIAGTCDGGTWSATLSVPGTPSTTTVEVWGVDSASPPNTGAAATAPAKLTAVTNYDRTGPSVAIGASLPSYLPESGWSLRLDSSGHPLVPVQYNTSGVLTAVNPGSTVYKLGTTLRAADGNTPVLTYQVSTSGKAPIATAVLTNAVPTGVLGCTKIPSCTRTHALTLSTRTAPGYAFYDLPLTFEMLDGRTGALTLNTVFADVLGQVATRADSLTLTVLPPPVAISEDATYPNDADPRSVFAYHLAGGTYGSLFDPASPYLGPGTNVRVIRYVAENPTPYPLALNLRTANTDEVWVTESWQNLLYDQTKVAGWIYAGGVKLQTQIVWDSTYTCNDFTPHQTCTLNSFGLPYDPNPLPPRCTGDCWYETASPSAGEHCLAAGANSWTGPSYSLAGVIDTAAPSTAAFTDYKAAGGETVSAAQYYSPSLAATVGAIVPAASSTTPGRLVVYILAHVPSATRAASNYPPLLWQGLPETPSLSYQWTAGYVYKWLSETWMQCNSTVTWAYSNWFNLNKLNQQLTAAKWTFVLAPKVTTGAFTVDPTTPVVEGPPTGTAALPAISRTWSH